MVHLHNIEQGTDEWLEARKGMLTASNATAIGANGAGLKTYCKQIAMELDGGERKYFTNADIERGNELEPIGRESYEFEKSANIVEVGGITNDLFPGVWISPDGLVGTKGGVEIKARNDEKHYSLILGETKEIPFNQIQMSLLISDREWWDFISINTNFNKPLFIKRIYPDEQYFEKLKSGFIEGRKLIKLYREKYTQY